MKRFLTDKFRRMEHTAQVETLVSPTDCPTCNALRLAIRQGGPLAVEIRLQLDKHCREEHNGVRA
jgi:hypothetical protein